MTRREAIVKPYRERYMKCASCRSDARYAVASAASPDRITTSCARHLELWRSRKSVPTQRACTCVEDVVCGPCMTGPAPAPQPSE